LIGRDQGGYTETPPFGSDDFDRKLIFPIYSGQQLNGTVFQDINSIGGVAFLKQPLAFLNPDFFSDGGYTLQLRLRKSLEKEAG
jgi:hypothetical protein